MEARRKLSLGLHQGQRWVGTGDRVQEGGSGPAPPGVGLLCGLLTPPPTLDPHFSHPQSKRAEPDNGQRAPEGLAPTFCSSKPEHS